MLSRARSRLTYANIVASLALFVALGGSAVALDVVPFAKKAKFADKAGVAKKAGKVDGFNASSNAKPNTLIPLDADGRLPESVGAVGPQGERGPQGEPGPKGETGAVDSSNFYTKAASDGRYLPQAGTAADADLFDGLDSTDFLLTSATAGGALTGPLSNLSFAGSAVAPDANKLDGRGGARYLVLCDEGMLRAGDLCFESALRSPAAPVSAVGTCASANRRLPSVDELLRIWNDRVSSEYFPSSDTPILTGDFTDDLTVKSPVISSGAFALNGTTGTGTARAYVCVESPTN